MKATVVVTHLDDPRVVHAVESALAQGPIVHEVLVADGGTKPALLEELGRRLGARPRVRILHLPGSVADSRNSALSHIKSELTAFLDADQVAPPGWLDALTAPIRNSEADFTGGPTRPKTAPKSRAEAYVNRQEADLYAVVPRDLALLPMGNSAWRTDLLRRLGFDPRLAGGGEDYDVNLRALRSGARGVFVPGAVVAHDQSHLDSFRKVLRRKSRYYMGAAVAYLKNDQLGARGRSAARRFRVRHPVDLLDVVLKPWALLRARQYARRVFPRPRTGPRAW